MNSEDAYERVRWTYLEWQRHCAELEQQVAELTQERDRYRDAIKHAIRLLSFGGDTQIMAYLVEALADSDA